MMFFCKMHQSDGISQTESDIRYDINNIVMDVMDINADDFYNGQQKRKITAARHIAWHFTRVNTDLTLTEIGEPFNKKHSTVHYATRKTKNGGLLDRLKYDTILNKWFNECKTELNFRNYKTTKIMTKTTNQVGGDHYRGLKMQPMEFFHINKIGFLEGSIIKYVCRHKNKNGREDLEKAGHYLNVLIEMEYGGDSNHYHSALK